METMCKTWNSFLFILCLAIRISCGVGMTSRYKTSHFQRFYGGIPVSPVERFENIYPADVKYCLLMCNYDVDCTHFNTTDDMSYCLLYNYTHCAHHPGEDWNLWMKTEKKRGKTKHIYTYRIISYIKYLILSTFWCKGVAPQLYTKGINCSPVMWLSGGREQHLSLYLVLYYIKVMPSMGIFVHHTSALSARVWETNSRSRVKLNLAEWYLGLV